MCRLHKEGVYMERYSKYIIIDYKRFRVVVGENWKWKQSTQCQAEEVSVLWTNWVGGLEDGICLYEVQLPGIKNLKCPELVIATLVLVLDDVPPGAKGTQRVTKHKCFWKASEQDNCWENSGRNLNSALRALVLRDWHVTRGDIWWSEASIKLSGWKVKPKNAT